MAWLRLDDKFPHHPKFEGWSGAQRWAFLELMSYCARYSTGGYIPTDTSLLPRGVTPSLLRLAETSGWIDRDDTNALIIHDWPEYNPKDETAAIRMRAYRERNKNRNQAVTADVTERNETVTRARTPAEPVPSIDQEQPAPEPVVHQKTAGAGADQESRTGDPALGNLQPLGAIITSLIPKEARP